MADPNLPVTNFPTEARYRPNRIESFTNVLQITENSARKAAVRDAWFQECKIVKNKLQTSRNFPKPYRRIMAKAGGQSSATKCMQFLRENKIRVNGELKSLTEIYKGHHINSVKSPICRRMPQLVRNPDNIWFLTEAEHRRVHRNFGGTNASGGTRGRLFNRTEVLNRQRNLRSTDRLVQPGRAGRALLNVEQRISEVVGRGHTLLCNRSTVFNRISSGARSVASSNITRGILRSASVVAAVNSGYIMITGTDRERWTEAGRVIGGGGGALLGAGWFSALTAVAGSFIGGWAGENLYNVFHPNQTSNINDQDNNDEQIIWNRIGVRDDDSMFDGNLNANSLGGVSFENISNMHGMKLPEFTNRRIKGFRINEFGVLEITFLSEEEEEEETEGETELRTQRSIQTENVSYEDLLVSLLCLYEHRAFPTFSLDPSDPQNVETCEMYEKVYSPRELLRGTSFGDTLFRTDYEMKCIALGVKCTNELTGELVKVGNAVPGLLNESQLGDISSARRRYRLWIEVDGIESFVESGKQNLIQFGNVKMKARKRRIQIDPNARSGLRDTEDVDEDDQFSKLFTRHYNDLCSQYSNEFERLKDLTKLVYLSQWLMENQIKIDVERIKAELEAIKINRESRSSHVDQVHRLNVKYKTSTTKTQTSTVTLEGGVVLNIAPPSTNPPQLRQKKKKKNETEKKQDPKNVIGIPCVSTNNYMDDEGSHIVDYSHEELEKMKLIRELVESKKYKKALCSIDDLMTNSEIRTPELFTMKTKILEAFSSEDSKSLDAKYNHILSLYASFVRNGLTKSEMKKLRNLEDEFVVQKYLNLSIYQQHRFGELSFRLPKFFMPFSLENNPYFCGFLDTSMDQSLEFFRDIVSIQAYKNEEMYLRFLGDDKRRRVVQNIGGNSRQKLLMYEHLVQKDDEGDDVEFESSGIVTFENRIRMNNGLYVISGTTIKEKENIFRSFFFNHFRETITSLSIDHHQQNPPRSSQSNVNSVSQTRLFDGMSFEEEIKHMLEESLKESNSTKTIRSPSSPIITDSRFERDMEEAMRVSRNNMNNEKKNRDQNNLENVLRISKREFEEKNQLEEVLRMSREQAKNEEQERRRKIQETKREEEEERRLKEALLLSRVHSREQSEREEQEIKIMKIKNMGFSDGVTYGDFGRITIREILVSNGWDVEKSLNFLLRM